MVRRKVDDVIVAAAVVVAEVRLGLHRGSRVRAERQKGGS